MPKLTVDAARRIALASQGFSDSRPKTVTVAQFRRAMDRMSVLQLDSVNVICRSHYLPILARLGPYDRAKLDKYLYHSGRYFEYLAHVASISSQQNRPLLRHRMQQEMVRRRSHIKGIDRGYIEAVLAEVSDRGPVSIKDLSDPGGRTGPWWGHSKGKVALEWLYVTGQLSIAERTKMFVTVYDIPERVIQPDILNQPDVDDDDAQMALLLKGAKAHGIGTAADIVDYYRLNGPRSRPLLANLVATGQLEQVTVQGWDEPALLHPEAKRPRSIKGRALLTPFDPVVWFRPRAERLFDFEYRIEIYVPEPKRKFGYYVLPFLLDGRLVARVDLKADRKAGKLLVRGSYVESHVATKKDTQRVASELSGSLIEMASWLDLDDVQVEPKGDLARDLLAAHKE